jgi:hypothetical protein
VADLNVASRNGIMSDLIKSKLIKAMPEAQIVETVIEETMRVANQIAQK